MNIKNDILKQINDEKRKYANIYALAFASGKLLGDFSIDEKKEFISILEELENEQVIKLKRSKNGVIGGFDSKVEIIKKVTSVNRSYILKCLKSSSEVAIKQEYYLKNPEEFLADEVYIKNLLKTKDLSKLTVNELSYLVFGDEKAISQPEKSKVNGKKILSNLEVDIYSICRDTIEPFYFPKDKKSNIVLIVENKETCFSLLCTDINLKGIIYGEGRAILKIFKFIHLYGLDIDTDIDVEFHYFGDIDQEGFDIAQRLIDNFDKYNIKLSYMLYENLSLRRSHPIKSLRDIKMEFPCINQLDTSTQKRVWEVLNNKHIIPQEALNFTELEKIYGL